MEEELEREKERALNILGQITGTTPRSSKKRKRSNSDILKPRYDPDNEANEQCTNVSTRVLDSRHDHKVQEETFYEVTENLTNSFKKKAKKKNRNHEFNFLAEMEVESDDSTTGDGGARPTSNGAISGEDNPTPTVGEGTNVQLGAETTDNVEVNPHSSPFLFFFHTTSPTLRNRLDSSKRFVRTV